MNEYTDYKLLMIRKDLYDEVVADLATLNLETHPVLHLLRSMMLTTDITGQQTFYTPGTDYPPENY